MESVRKKAERVSQPPENATEKLQVTELAKEKKRTGPVLAIEKNCSKKEGRPRKENRSSELLRPRGPRGLRDLSWKVRYRTIP